MAYFVHEIGYSGLIIFLDEAVSLYRISHSVSRRNNYERFLTIFNDTQQGGAAYLGVFFGATPDMVDDSRRGLFSYEALQTRLQTSRFVRDGMRDLNAPVIRLNQLSSDSIYLLLEKICAIHAFNYKYAPRLGNEQFRAFMTEVSSRLGADSMLTPRVVAIDFVTILNLLRQYPEETFESLLDTIDFTTSTETDPEMIDSLYASFEI